VWEKTAGDWKVLYFQETKDQVVRNAQAVIVLDSHRVKSWEILADNLKKAGLSWGCVSALDCEGRTIWN
jgi:hypothetical protein